jgi:hypothetical protein
MYKTSGEGAIKNGQSRETANKTKKKKQNINTTQICVGQRYAQKTKQSK